MNDATSSKVATGVDLIYKLNGDMDQGISVRDLSPFLIAFADMVSEAHKTLYPASGEMTVRVKPFRQGSFEITMLLSAGSAGFMQLVDFLGSDQANGIVSTLCCLGVIQNASGYNLVQLIRYLKGKHSKSVEALPSGEYRYHSDDNSSSMTVSGNVHNLYQNCNIQQNIYTGLGKPLEVEGVTSAESFLEGDEDSKTVYEKDIVEPIREYSSAMTDCPVAGGDKHIENTRKLYVRVRRASLEGETTHWSFRTGTNSNSTVFQATVHDEAFLEKVKQGTIRLSFADLLLVELVEKQTVKGTNTSITNEIVRVLEYKKAPGQGAFDEV